MDAELLNDIRAKQLLKARRVAYVYAHPEQPRFLHELSVALDEMCDAMRLPRMPEQGRRLERVV